MAAVKLGWYLSLKQDRNQILKQGATPLVSISGGLKAKDKTVIEFPVVSFAAVSKPLLKNGTLAGDFEIYVAVTEVVYENGSVWSRDEIKKVTPG